MSRTSATCTTTIWWRAAPRRRIATTSGRGARGKLAAAVAASGAPSGIVRGGRPVKPMDVDLRWVGGIMYKNSEIEETGVADGVLGHPALGVAWLANNLGRHGGARGAG